MGIQRLVRSYFAKIQVGNDQENNPLRFNFFKETQEIADKAAAMVKVTYTNIKTPILTIDDAIRNKSTFPSPFPTFKTGNADGKYTHFIIYKDCLSSIRGTIE